MEILTDLFRNIFAFGELSACPREGRSTNTVGSSQLLDKTDFYGSIIIRTGLDNVSRIWIQTQCVRAGQNVYTCIYGAETFNKTASEKEASVFRYKLLHKEKSRYIQKGEKTLIGMQGLKLTLAN